MARIYANIFCAIWDDDEFCSLTSDAQRTYFMLVTQKEITACGSLPLTLRRWSRMLPEQDRDTLEPALVELAAHRFILIDEDTEELLVRTFPKHDGGYKHSKRVLAVIAYAEAIRSQSLRSAVAVELDKLGVRTAIPLPTDSQPIANQEAIGSRRVVVTEVSTNHNPESTTLNPHSATPEGEPSPLDSAEPPSMFCKNHPNGTEAPCGPCGTAKLRYKAWHESKLAGQVTAKASRVQAIRECELCDDVGMVLDPDSGKPLRRCDHRRTA